MASNGGNGDDNLAGAQLPPTAINVEALPLRRLAADQQVPELIISDNDDDDDLQVPDAIRRNDDDDDTGDDTNGVHPAGSLDDIRDFRGQQLPHRNDDLTGFDPAGANLLPGDQEVPEVGRDDLGHRNINLTAESASSSAAASSVTPEPSETHR